MLSLPSSWSHRAVGPRMAKPLLPQNPGPQPPLLLSRPHHSPASLALELISPSLSRHKGDFLSKHGWTRGTSEKRGCKQVLPRPWLLPGQVAPSIVSWSCSRRAKGQLPGKHRISGQSLGTRQCTVLVSCCCFNKLGSLKQQIYSHSSEGQNSDMGPLG